MIVRVVLSLVIALMCTAAVQAGDFASYIKAVDKKREANTAKLLEARKKKGKTATKSK